ncbi:MAG: hypothetical protein ABEI27_03160 [Halobellus sp.]|uniref:hypothetical protein n=1 Tax=Halobellus sp. TaxID=1979212 RepID=UPI0035D4942D
MDSSSVPSLETDETTVRVGDGLYDSKYDRVLWVSRIDDSGVTVEPATEYEVEESIGWPPGGQTGVITPGTTFEPMEFVGLVDAGRFEVAPR